MQRKHPVGAHLKKRADLDILEARADQFEGDVGAPRLLPEK